MERASVACAIEVSGRHVSLALVAACGQHVDRAAPPEPVVPRDATARLAIPHAPCPRGDCAPRTIASFHANRATDVVIDGDGYAYVTELFGNHIFKVRTEPGSTPIELYRSPSRASWGAALLGDDLLWSSNDTGRIYAAPKSGAGPIRVFADNLTGVGYFRIVGSWLYWADAMGSAPGTVWKRALAGGPSIALRTPAPRADDLVVDASGRVLFVDDSEHVFAIAPDGTTTIWLDPGDDTRPEGLAEDDRYVYVSTLTGKVLRVDKTSHSAEILVDVKGAAYAGIAVAGDSLYFVNYLDPALLTLPR